jgi:plastocyanin
MGNGMKRGLLSLVTAAVFLVSVACHPPAAVSITDNAYTPAEVQDAGHLFVDWTNNGAQDHTVTSMGKGAFFDSGNIPPSGMYSRAFENAGGFRYHCELHEMKGKVSVSPAASPPTGTTEDDYVIFWMQDEDEFGDPEIIDEGFNADVQINRPGPKGWEDWRVNQRGTNISAIFEPNKAGTFKFRARLQKGNPEAGKGVSSEYSHPLELVVTEAP